MFPLLLKFIYSEKATKLCEISTVDLSYVCSSGQIYGGYFAKYCGLLRIYELYPKLRRFSVINQKGMFFEEFISYLCCKIFLA